MSLKMRFVGKHKAIKIPRSPKYRGTFSGNKVYFGLFDGKDVAVKKIESDENAGLDTREIEHLRNFRHENIVRYLFMDEDEHEDALYIVLEKCECTLTEFIEHKQQSTRPLDILGPLCTGMVYLHLEKKLVHRDLKPCNILMMCSNGRWIPKISDFGLSRTIDRNKSKVSQTLASGTIGYMSPEALRNEKLDQHADIFSLGVIFYYVLTDGKKPFECDPLKLEYEIKEGTVIIDLNDVEEDAKSIVKAMIAHNREERPGIRQVLAHHLFWDGERKMSFIQEVSDMEISRQHHSTLCPILEAKKEEIVGDWRETLYSESEILESVFEGMKSKKQKDGVCDLLRTIRNMKNHYHEKPAEFKMLIGELPDGVCEFFTSRFSKLLTFVYEELRSISEELGLQKYYGRKDSNVYPCNDGENPPIPTFSTQECQDDISMDAEEFIQKISTAVHSNKRVEGVIRHLSKIVSRGGPIYHPDEDEKIPNPVAYALSHAGAAIHSSMATRQKPKTVTVCFHKLFVVINEIRQNEGNRYGNLLQNLFTLESLADILVKFMIELYEVLFPGPTATPENIKTRCVAVVWIACACSVDRWKHDYIRFYRIGIPLAESIPDFQAMARLQQTNANHLIMNGADIKEVDRFFVLALQAVKKMTEINTKLLGHILNERIDHILQSFATAIYGNREVDVHDVIRYLGDDNIPDTPKRFKVDDVTIDEDPVKSALSYILAAFIYRKVHALKLADATYCFHKIFLAINTLQDDEDHGLQKLLQNGATKDGVADTLIQLMIATYEAEFQQIDTSTTESAEAISFAAVWITEACLHHRWRKEANRFYEIGEPLAKRTYSSKALARLYHSRAKYLIMADAHEDEIDKFFELALKEASQMAKKNAFVVSNITRDRKQYAAHFISRIARSIWSHMDIDIPDVVERLKKLRGDDRLDDPRKFEVDSESIREDPVTYAMSFARAALLHSQNKPPRAGDAMNCFHKILLAIDAIQNEGSGYKELLQDDATLENVADILVRLMIAMYRAEFQELDITLLKIQP